MKKDNVIKFPAKSEIDQQFLELEKQRDVIELQAKVIASMARKKKEMDKQNGNT